MLCFKHPILIIIAALMSTMAAADGPPLHQRIDVAIESASAFLFEHQEEDGAWRASKYGAYRDGPTLSAHVVLALVRVAPNDDRTKRGLDYLASLVNEDGEIEQPLIMPVYTASQAALAFMDAGRPSDAVPWLNMLLAHQLTEANGWSRQEDVQFGGWGYSTTVPERPEDDVHARHFDANVSATVFALDALHLARHTRVLEVDRRVFTSALSFLRHCQNVAFDDGGFYFTPVDSVRNKAGVAGVDPTSRERFHSYGSATADGYRALVLAEARSMRERIPRLPLAWRWLGAHFDSASIPGTFNEDREVLRDAYYFYYAWSISEAWRNWRQSDAEPAHPAARRQALAEELLRRQKEVGSWTNPFTDGREDDPLIATPFAALALHALRRLTSQQSTIDGIP